MRIVARLFSCLALFLAIAAAPVLPARAAETCPFISAKELAAAMPAVRWSLISNQDGRGCIYQAGRGDTMMLSVFRNPDKDRASELYATFVKTLSERMPLSAVAGIGDEAQGGTSAAGAERQEASVLALSGDYILQISVYPIGRRADAALLGPITEAARVAIANVKEQRAVRHLRVAHGRRCRRLSRQRHADGAAHRRGQLHDVRSRRQHHDRRGDRDVARHRRRHDEARGPCTHVAVPELGREAFGEHSCTKGNGNAVTIYVWKNGRQASIVFAPVKPHPESGSIERLKAVAARVYGKL